MKRATWTLSCLIALAALWMPPAHAFSKKRPSAGPLSTSIRVGSIDLTRKNSLASGWGGSARCSVFKGTHAENTVNFEVEARGGNGEYRHALLYTLSRAYKLGQKTAGQVEIGKKGNGKIELELPELDDDVPFVQQTVFLVTRDTAGASVSTSLTFLVARPVILNVSADEKTRASNCFERYQATESSMGVLSNGSTAPSRVEIRQGIQKIWGSTRGWQWGVFVSPLAWTGLGNLFSLNYSYFSQTSKQTVETVEMASGYQLNPGDFMQLYVQATRYVTAYDAILVDPCGGTRSLPGAYRFQWWGFAYHLFPVNPFENARPPLEAVGAPPVNTCPAELSPFAPGAGKPATGAYEFRGTNL